MFAYWFCSPNAWTRSFRHTAVVTADAKGEILLVSSPAADHAGNVGYWANVSGIEICAIPEPGTIAGLLGLLLAGLFARRRK